MPKNDRFSESVGFKVLTPCATCKHRDPENSLDCKAFPDGIPDAILQGLHMHRSEFPGDGGIRYERK